ncbi:NADH-quinone oxidoreductase subunit C [Haliea sp. E1-2-M8]|uniref:hydrogenase large subunit n=1 Tax=Haliea sp. E1-2-M8 TaxID=3064706 RepID=UPI0027253B9A|nr:NADH-quinone oxidoreductase subunit C [Haliea sp. E1-2-M8]MDO8864083.1 NADH-quinone oxidoreductase subunit C [Haliea sp. E1-2-M8]
MADTEIQSFVNACATANIPVGEPDSYVLPPAVVIPVSAPFWQRAARVAQGCGLRWCSFWASPVDESYELFCVLEKSGDYLVLRTRTGKEEPLPSQAPIYPAADRLERHAHDLLGIEFVDAPDSRRWTRHQAWKEHEFPLRPDFIESLSQRGKTAADADYPFVRARGRGVVEIPVGPVHAGTIEPGHFRFQAVGETVLNLEERLGYVHKGIEKLAVGREPDSLVRLAGRVSGDSTVSHSWAACQALERATAFEVPPRALCLRAIMAERERVANHLGDIGAICNDVGFAFGQYQLTRLKETFVRTSHTIFGHRFMMDRVVPGGVSCDIDSAQITSMVQEAKGLTREAAEIVSMLEHSESLEDRLMTTGRLTPEQADQLGVVGYVGRASGRGVDVRHDRPYAPYDRLKFAVPVYRAGDVAARAKIRADEIGTSLDLLCQLLQSVPEGPVKESFPDVKIACEGLGIVEGWRGEILTYVQLDKDGTVTRFFPRDPSWLLWPALELLVQDNIVPDFPVCNKSVNASYSGHDL